MSATDIYEVVALVICLGAAAYQEGPRFLREWRELKGGK